MPEMSHDPKCQCEVVRCERNVYDTVTISNEDGVVGELDVCRVCLTAFRIGKSDPA